jgi:hypothetical protein
MENVGPRETKFGLMANPTVRSFCKEARKYWGFSTLKIQGERFAEGLNGGDGVRRITWSQCAKTFLRRSISAVFTGPLMELVV